MNSISGKPGKVADDVEYADYEGDLEASVEDRLNLLKQLAWLFGETIVEQANQIDIVDINMNKEITDCIATGVRQLKELKNDAEAQRDLVNSMETGARLLLCLWILDMGLLDKIQTRSYL